MQTVMTMWTRALIELLDLIGSTFLLIAERCLNKAEDLHYRR